MEFTLETLRLKCEEFKIRGENQGKLVKEFFEDYPNVKLKEEEYNYDCGRGVDYFSKDGSLILKFEDTSLGEACKGCTRSMGIVYFHGKDFSHILSEDGQNKVIPRSLKAVSADRKVARHWHEKIKNIFFHAR